MPTVEWIIFGVLPTVLRHIWRFIWVPLTEEEKRMNKTPLHLYIPVEPVTVPQATVRVRRKPLPWKLRFEILKRDKFTCQYCGLSGRSRELRIDHIIPVASGGNDEPFNLVTSCESCNGGKADVLLVDNSYLRRS